MRSFKKCLCIGLILVSVLSSLSIWVSADKAEDKALVDMSKQNAITAYALSFADNVDLQYVWGGYGGRKLSYNGEAGENDGYWSLEQCIKYIDDWSTNPEENKYRHYGTDCSGFVGAVYQHFGLDVLGVDTNDYYPEISKEEARPGDVVWYKAWNDEAQAYVYEHVALYLGDDLVIHVNARYGYSGRTTPYGGYMTADKNSTPTYCHISKVDYWSSAERHYFRVVEDMSKYPITESQKDSLSNKEFTLCEDDLVGMPIDGILTEDMLELMLPDLSGLSQNEKNNIAHIRDQMTNDTPLALRIVEVTTTVAGIALILYGIFLILGYVFDSVNSFIDISIVKLLSFGSIRLISKEEYSALMDENKKSYTSITKFYSIVAIVFVIGVLLVSGVVPKFIYKIASLFNVL